MSFSEALELSYVGFEAPQYENKVVRPEYTTYERFVRLHQAMSEAALNSGNRFSVCTRYGGHPRWVVLYNLEEASVEVVEQVGMEKSPNVVMGLKPVKEGIAVTYQNHDRAKGHHWDKLLGDWEAKMIEMGMLA